MSFEVLGIGQPLLDRVVFVCDELFAQLGITKGGSELMGETDLDELVDRVLRLQSEICSQERNDHPTGENQLYMTSSTSSVSPFSFLFPNRSNTPSGGSSRQHILSSGGSCSNTMKTLAQLGEKCALVGKVGSDQKGEIFSQKMRERGVIVLSSPSDKPAGQVVCLVTPDGERTMRANLGAAEDLVSQDLVAEDFGEARHVHTEGYLLYHQGLLQRALRLAKRARATVSFDLGSFEVVKLFRNEILRLLPKYVDVLFCNEEEAYCLTGSSPKEALSVLSQVVNIVVVTCGRNGCWVQGGADSEPFHCPAYPVETIDSTGAGDLFAAGFLHAWFQGYALEQCARLGSLCGAAVVSKMGTDLDSRDIEALRSRMNDAIFTSPRVRRSMSALALSSMDDSDLSRSLSVPEKSRHSLLFSSDDTVVLKSTSHMVNFADVENPLDSGFRRRHGPHGDVLSLSDSDSTPDSSPRVVPPSSSTIGAKSVFTSENTTEETVRYVSATSFRNIPRTGAVPIPISVKVQGIL